ncbi:MAG TPA: SgcJ/EcaC family oxidoreductase [Thermoanaerobaculia bacterium]
MHFLLTLVLLAAEGPLQPVNAFLNALANADADALVATFHDDATVFLPMTTAPQRMRGKQQIRDAFAPAFTQWGKSKRAEPGELETEIHGDTAIVTFHLGKLQPDQPTSFSRRTFVLTRKDGRWLIAHLHASNVMLQPKK